jgi:hypothetical protein
MLYLNLYQTTKFLWYVLQFFILILYSCMVLSTNLAPDQVTKDDLKNYLKISEESCMLISRQIMASYSLCDANKEGTKAMLSLGSAH